MVASVENSAMVPNILAGRIDVAKEYGIEAWTINEALYECDPERYTVQMLDICNNLGGIYLDENELESAEKLISLGLAVYD